LISQEVITDLTGTARVDISDKAINRNVLQSLINQRKAKANIPINIKNAQEESNAESSVAEELLNHVDEQMQKAREEESPEASQPRTDEAESNPITEIRIPETPPAMNPIDDPLGDFQLDATGIGRGLPPGLPSQNMSIPENSNLTWEEVIKNPDIRDAAEAKGIFSAVQWNMESNITKEQIIKCAKG